MNIFKQNYFKVKNIPQITIPKDFQLNVLSFFIIGIFLAAGTVLQLTFGSPMDPVILAAILAGVVTVSATMAFFPMWIVVLLSIILFWAGMYIKVEGNFYPLFAGIALGLLLAPSFQLVQQWEKTVILRLGKYRKTKGAGIFFMLPLVDRAAAFVDTRIRVTDFKAEKTLTMDTVPVDVDALCFWMIWDVTKAVLEVENFMEAVVLSAQTALRDAIGKHELAELLSDRAKLGREIKDILEIKTSPWGITILSIEITDIAIPKELEDSMSKRAQAERERQARVILGTAEVEVSAKFAQAALMYKDNPTALHLRAMNMVYEGIRNNSTIMLLPSTALESMSLGTMMGALSLAKDNNNNDLNPKANDPVQQQANKHEPKKETLKV